MSASIAAAAKVRLVGTGNVLSGLAGLTGVTVAYQMPLRDVPRELVYGGKVTSTPTLAGMRGNVRLRREEDLTATLHIRVHQEGKATSEDADARALALANAIEEYIAANPTLGDLANLKLARVDEIELQPGSITDQAAVGEVDMIIGLKAFHA